MMKAEHERTTDAVRHRPLTWRQLMEAVEEMDHHVRQLLQVQRVPRAARVEALAVHEIAEGALQRDGRRVAPLFPREPKPHKPKS